MPWFLTPHGPHFVVEPGTIDEYERRDYVLMTQQQATDYFAGVAFPEPPSFATEAEVPGIMATVAANPSSAFSVAQRAAFVSASQLFVTEDTTTADINAWLAEPSPFRVKRLIGDAVTTDALIVHSDTYLDATDATITMAPGTDKRMLANAAFRGAGARDQNITIVGGIWDKGANSGSGPLAGLELHCLIFHRLDGLRVEDVTVKNTAAKYCILLGDVTRFDVIRPFFDGHSDGVHVQGPAYNGTIQSPRGRTGDDFVAFTSQDYDPEATIGGGDIMFVKVTDVVCGAGTLGNGVKLSAGGAGRKLRHIVIDGLGGSVDQNMVAIDNRFEDEYMSNPGTVLANDVDHIDIRNVSGAVGTARALVAINGAGIGHVVIDTPELTDDATSAAGADMVRVFPEAVVETITVRDPVLRSGSVMHKLVSTDPGSVVGVIRTTSLTVRTISARMFNINGALSDLVIVNPDVTYTVSGEPFILANSAFDVHILGGTIRNCFAVLQSASPTTDLQTLFVDGLKCTSLGLLVFATHANSRVRILASSYTDTLTGSANVWQQASGSQVTAHGQHFKTRVGDITGSAGDIVWNTDAGAACGTGPVISNGTNWKNLYTGATTA